MSDLRLAITDHSANFRHQLGCDRAAALPGQRRDNLTAKGGLPCRLTLEPGDGAVDRIDRQLVAGLRVVGPGETTVALEDDTGRLRVLAGELLQPQPKLEAGRFQGSQPISSP